MKISLELFTTTLCPHDAHGAFSSLSITLQVQIVHKSFESFPKEISGPSATVLYHSFRLKIAASLGTQTQHELVIFSSAINSTIIPNIEIAFYVL